MAFHESHKFNPNNPQIPCELCGVLSWQPSALWPCKGEKIESTISLIEEQSPSHDGVEDDCWLLVIKDMKERRKMGIEKYGVPVRADNGRDALTDAYQECLDMCVYLRQAIEQRRIMQETIDKLYPIIDNTPEVTDD